MKAVITRPMKVAGDNGGIVSFNPSTGDKPFAIISDTVFSRLRRAGAAVPYSEPAQQTEEPISPEETVQQPEAEPVGLEGAETGANNQTKQGKSKKK